MSLEISDKFISNSLGIKNVIEPKINPPDNVTILKQISTVFHPSFIS